MLALVYRFEQNEEGPSQRNYLRQYQEQLTNARIRFEKSNSVEKGIRSGVFLLQKFNESHMRPRSLPSASTTLEAILKWDNRTVDEYLLRRYDCNALIELEFDPNEDEEYEIRLSSLKRFCDLHLENESKFQPMFDAVMFLEEN